MLNEATRANLRRKSAYVDVVQMHNGKPLPSLVELNITELCNRSAGSAKPCVFCPRIDAAFFPNQKLHMSLTIAGKIASDLGEIDYRGTVVLCGYGEPILHPRLEELVKGFAGVRVEIVTNGDFLSAAKIASLSDAGVKFFIVSMYDGAHQVERLTAMFAEAGCTDYLLRDRWHTEADQFGLKLTNRAGTVEVGPQAPVDQSRPCHYPAYEMLIDWNGDVLLCPQDWHRKVRFGNVAGQSLLSVWTSPALHKRRRQLIDGRRCEAPCNGCNTDGTLHGFNHVPAWTGEAAKQCA